MSFGSLSILPNDIFTYLCKNQRVAFCELAKTCRKGQELFCYVKEVCDMEGRQFPDVIMYKDKWSMLDDEPLLEYLLINNKIDIKSFWIDARNQSKFDTIELIIKYRLEELREHMMEINFLYEQIKEMDDEYEITSELFHESIAQYAYGMDAFQDHIDILLIGENHFIEPTLRSFISLLFQDRGKLSGEESVYLHIYLTIIREMMLGKKVHVEVYLWDGIFKILGKGLQN